MNFEELHDYDTKMADIGYYIDSIQVRFFEYKMKRLAYLVLHIQKATKTARNMEERVW